MEPRQLDITAARETLVRNQSVWQMNFLRSGDLETFTKEHGLTVTSGQVNLLWKVGLLRADFVISKEPQNIEGLREIVVDGDTRYFLDERIPRATSEGWLNRGLEAKDSTLTPYFHPFRYYVIYHILRVFNFNVTPLQALHSVEGYYRLVTHLSEHLYKWTASPDSAVRMHYWNQIPELITLLEPCHLQRIDQRFKWSAFVGEEETERGIDEIRAVVHSVIRALGREFCEELHQDLCVDTQILDDNRDVHTILRLGGYRIREKLRGKIGGAVLVRTMAEVLRRATEQVFEATLREEDERGFGMYPENLKTEIYGAARLLDGDETAKREFLRQFQLDANVRLRWYVEGHTEYGGLQSIFDTQSFRYVEVINLRGFIAEKGTLAFRESLKRDMDAHVFSYVSIDGDRSDYVGLLRKAAEDRMIFGELFISTPDFEFFNFTCDELTAILWGMLEQEGATTDEKNILNEALKDEKTADGFFKAFHRALPSHAHIGKGDAWGAELIRYADAHPNLADGKERPIVTAVRNALRSRFYNYITSRDRLVLDLTTGRLIDKKP